MIEVTLLNSTFHLFPHPCSFVEGTPKCSKPGWAGLDKARNQTVPLSSRILAVMIIDNVQCSMLGSVLGFLLSYLILTVAL